MLFSHECCVFGTEKPQNRGEIQLHGCTEKRVQYGTNKKGNVLWNIAFSSGASCLTRTGDTLINSQVLKRQITFVTARDIIPHKNAFCKPFFKK